MTAMQALGSAFWGRELVALEWRKLCFVAYTVDAALAAPELPPSLSLERVGHQALVTLVAWQTRYPQVFGRAPARPAQSTELALRVLVREGARRGSVTVQEDSSSPLAAAATRLLFREPARHSATGARLTDDGGQMVCTYELARDGAGHRIRIRAAQTANAPRPDTLAYALTHRPYAYARSARGQLLRYDLDHPPWAVHAVTDYDIDLDFAALYGSRWAGLSALRPAAVMFAEGSSVRISLPE